MRNLPVMDAIAHRLNAAFFTIPDTSDWLLAAALLLSYTLVSLPVGLLLDFTKIEVPTSWRRVAGVMAIAFLSPAVSEELFFRVLLLPHPTENISGAAQISWICFSLVIFIIYHPLNALTFYPAGNPTFMNPVFLFLTTLLGVACAIAYLHSGSLWPPIIIHWIIVVVWLLLLGGDSKLHDQPKQ